MGEYYIYCKKADFNRIAEQFHISPMLARILRNRDIVTDREIEEYLHGGTDQLYDPFRMKGIEEAVPLLFRAAEEGKKIRIIGDYDCDGVCSSYILRQYLCFLGADADIRLPDRVEEGYGMNPRMVREAAKDQVSLLLTCDNGVSSYGAVEEAKKLGIRVIVSDHHEVPLPLIGADAVIDPKQPEDTYPYQELCGAGVAYKIICALDMVLKGKGPYRSVPAPEAMPLSPQKAEASGKLLRELLPFAAIATIADVVPLTGENRILAKEGLAVLRKTENPGLLALMKERRIEPERIDSYHIGFIIAPAINSAGRMKHASLALSLLQAEREEAERIAGELSGLNEERKKITEVHSAEAQEKAEEILEREGALPPVLVIYLPDAHESVAGIVAGRMRERYERPAIILTDSREGIKGSGRSIDPYPMIEELRKHPELFFKLGGHAKAAGFTLAEGISPERLEKELLTTCQLKDEDLVDKHWIDMQLPFAYATEDFCREMEVIEPYGLGNPRPVFAAKDIRVDRVMLFGKNNHVLRLTLTDPEGYTLDAVRFGAEEELSEIYYRIQKKKEKQGDSYRISFTYFPMRNEYRGITSVQLRILDLIRS